MIHNFKKVLWEVGSKRPINKKKSVEPYSTLILLTEGSSKTHPIRINNNVHADMYNTPYQRS